MHLGLLLFAKFKRIITKQKGEMMEILLIVIDVIRNIIILKILELYNKQNNKMLK